VGSIPTPGTTNVLMTNEFWDSPKTRRILTAELALAVALAVRGVLMGGRAQDRDGVEPPGSLAEVCA
jgi:hypothetical protein